MKKYICSFTAYLLAIIPSAVFACHVFNWGNVNGPASLQYYLADPDCQQVIPRNAEIISQADANAYSKTKYEAMIQRLNVRIEKIKQEELSKAKIQSDILPDIINQKISTTFPDGLAKQLDDSINNDRLKPIVEQALMELRNTSPKSVNGLKQDQLFIKSIDLIQQDNATLMRITPISKTVNGCGNNNGEFTSVYLEMGDAGDQVMVAQTMISFEQMKPLRLVKLDYSAPIHGNDPICKIKELGLDSTD